MIKINNLALFPALCDMFRFAEHITHLFFSLFPRREGGGGMAVPLYNPDTPMKHSLFPALPYNEDKNPAQPILTLGNLTIDDIVLYDERRMYLANSGGDALFSAIGAWIWHTPAGLIARAGTGYPASNIAALQAAGITCHLQRVPFNDIRNWALYEPDGSRQFCSHCSSGSYEQMSIRADEIPNNCMGADAYHIAPMPVDIQQGILQRLRSQTSIISLDMFTQHLRDARLIDTALALIPQVDCFLPSRAEAAILYGSDDPHEAARAFAASGVPVVCIKLGDEGSLLFTAFNDRFEHIPACRVKAVDPTGAGDSFCGGFLAGLLATSDPLTAACCGTVSASYVVETVGALQVLEMNFSGRQQRLEQVRSAVTSA